ncbi:MAG TPA: TrmH family RNA methyltransferase [Bryobacteraceae bacterium]|nr:TrmH family RNA methyltransferase [Bryobacteraceae bacterium]HPT25916.1 TrmH family RNA methyltransferase [Bryobacteraceae bacterium]
MDSSPFDNLAVVLVETRNPLNIGAVARAMSNFGCFDLRLVNPYDVSFHEAVSAVGAQQLLKDARVYGSVAGAVADCALVVAATGSAHRMPLHPYHRLEKAGRLLRRHLVGARAAILFGSEKHGLGNNHMANCHWLLRIPTRAEHESMNLAQAVAVCLYELARQPHAARSLPALRPLAGAGEVERFTLLLEEILRQAEYTKDLTSASSSEKIHRLVRRLNIPAKDATVLTGMLRQILWKLNSSGQ